jgi:hypothetical protein
MLEQIITAAGIGAIIGTVVIVRRKRQQRTVQLDSIAVEDWPTMEDRLRWRATEMRIERIADDARTILRHQYAGSTGSRRQMKASNMAETRWENAIRLLRDLGIYEQGGNMPQFSAYHALRKVEQWKRDELVAQRGRAGVKSYVSPR